MFDSVVNNSPPLKFNTSNSRNVYFILESSYRLQASFLYNFVFLEVGVCWQLANIYFTLLCSCREHPEIRLQNSEIESQLLKCLLSQYQWK